MSSEEGLSCIHLLGIFSTIGVGLLSPAFPSVSAYRLRSGRTGHGSTLDAETVNTDAKNVRPNRVETNVRRCWYVRRKLLEMDILQLFVQSIVSGQDQKAGGLRTDNVPMSSLSSNIYLRSKLFDANF